MSGKDRIAIFPSRANNVAMKARIVSANKGLSLLKRKRDALDLKLREITAQRAGLAQNFQEMYSDAIFSIAKANFLETDFKPALVIGSERADACMRLTYTKTIGLLLPTFEPLIRKPESLPLTGLSRGGAQVDIIREKFQELLRTIILLASLDYSIRTLKDSIRTNNMRLNGLEYVVIPKFNNTAAYIRDELDEMEREEFYRLKRSQGKQRALREKGKEKPAGYAEKGKKSYADAGTWTGDDVEKEEEKFVPLPLSIFMKKKFASAAQTIITGHFPGSYEIISPTDSIISGDVPTVSKRSPFQPFHVEKKESEPVIKPSDTQPRRPSRTSTSSDKPTKRVSLQDDENVPERKTPTTPAPAPPIKSELEEELKKSPRPSVEQPSKSQSNVPNKNESEDIPTKPTSVTSVLPLTSTIIKTEPEVKSSKPPSPSTSSAKMSALNLSIGGSVETSSAIIDVKHFKEPSSSRAPSENLEIISVHDMEAQTDISGRYPHRSEMDLPLFDGSTDPYTARSQTHVPGRHGRSSNTDHGNTSESDSEDIKKPPRAE